MILQSHEHPHNSRLHIMFSEKTKREKEPFHDKKLYFLCSLALFHP